MTLSEFKTGLLSKVNGKTNATTQLPSDTILIDRIYEGMKKIAHETVVMKYVVQSSAGVQVLRKLDTNTFIRFPKKPLSDSSEIDMDAALMDALYRWILASLERSNAQNHMQLFNSHINDNNTRLTEASLDEPTEYSSFTMACGRFA